MLLRNSIQMIFIPAAMESVVYGWGKSKTNVQRERLVSLQYSRSNCGLFCSAFMFAKLFCKCSPYSNKNGIERRTRDRPTESRNSFLLPIKIVLWRGEGMGTQNATIFHNKTTIFISRIHSTCHVKRNRLILFFAVPCFVCP